jgi:hypothetical protein
MAGRSAERADPAIHVFLRVAKTWMQRNSGLPELESLSVVSRVDPTYDVKPGHDEERFVQSVRRSAGTTFIIFTICCPTNIFAQEKIVSRSLSGRYGWS